MTLPSRLQMSASIRMQAVLITIVVVALCLGAKSAPVLLGLTALGLFVFHERWLKASEFRAVMATPPALASLAFGVYAVLTATWAPAGSDALANTAFVLAILAAVIIAVTVIKDLSEAATILAAGWMVIGFFIGLLLHLQLALTDQSALIWIANQVPALRHEGRHWSVIGDRVVAVHPESLRHSVVTMTMLCWVALLGAWRLFPRIWNFLISALVAIGTVLVIFLSWDRTAKIAIIIAAVVFLSARMLPVLTQRTLIGVWTVAVLGILPVTAGLEHIVRETKIDVGSSLGARIEMWRYLREKSSDHMIFGKGAGATIAADQSLGDQQQRPPWTGQPRVDIPIQPLRHPHNLYMQTWYELGFVGALLLFGTGLCIISSFSRAPSATQPFLTAAFASWLIIGTTKWDMWQSWQFASVGVVAMMSFLAVRAACIAPHLEPSGPSFTQIALPASLTDTQTGRRTMLAAAILLPAGFLSFWGYALILKHRLNNDIHHLSQCVEDKARDCELDASRISQFLANTDTVLANSPYTPFRLFIASDRLLLFNPDCREFAETGHRLIVQLRAEDAHGEKSVDKTVRSQNHSLTFGKGELQHRSSDVALFQHGATCLCLLAAPAPRITSITFGRYDPIRKQYVWRHAIAN